MLVLYLPHVTTHMGEGVAAHMQGGEGFYCKVGYPIMYLVMTSRDEAVLLTIQGMAYGKFGIADIEVWGLYAVA